MKIFYLIFNVFWMVYAEKCQKWTVPGKVKTTVIVDEFFWFQKYLSIKSIRHDQQYMQKNVAPTQIPLNLKTAIHYNISRFHKQQTHKTTNCHHNTLEHSLPTTSYITESQRNNKPIIFLISRFDKQQTHKTTKYYYNTLEHSHLTTSYITES